MPFPKRLVSSETLDNGQTTRELRLIKTWKSFKCEHQISKRIVKCQIDFGFTRSLFSGGCNYRHIAMHKTLTVSERRGSMTSIESKTPNFKILVPVLAFQAIICSLLLVSFCSHRYWCCCRPEKLEGVNGAGMTRLGEGCGALGVNNSDVSGGESTIYMGRGCRSGK